jgi:TonB-linked SusC/RagA family outer membrane protein
MIDKARAMTALVFAALAAGLGSYPAPLAAQSTGSIRGRVVESGTQRALSGAQISIPNTTLRVVANASGEFVLANVPAGSQRVRASLIGFGTSDQTAQVTAGEATQLNFTLTPAALALDQIVVTALGQTTTQRALGTSQQTVRGAEIAETQRENFVNALQGRVAGVEVTSSSGVPGASSQITIRGVSSISSSNQPLMIVDGLPIDNKTTNTSQGTGGGFVTDFGNRQVDFSSRTADISPEDIESLVVLKGPEAAALYGIDAANGAIVITTKRGRTGRGGIEYSNSFRIETPRGQPEIQRVYSSSSTAGGTYTYFGAPYEAGTQFYDNVGNFFQTATTQRHNLAFSGASGDNRTTYRLAGTYTDQNGVVPNSTFDRITLTGASQSQVKPWLNADLSVNYSFSENSQPFNGFGGPLIGLLVWPQTDNAVDYLTPAGTRRRLAALGTSTEVDNPFFNVNRNYAASTNNRLITNVGLTFSPMSWGNLKVNVGSDSYTTQYDVLRHPESAYAITVNGSYDVMNDITRNNNGQAVLSVNRRPVTRGFAVSGLVGASANDYRTQLNGMRGQDFLEPNFVSVNNASQRTNLSSLTRRRLASGFASATLDYNRYLFVTLQGRNDWTSTIPEGANSFFYPSVTSSFVFSDAIPAIGEFMTGKLKASYAQVGKDARAYAFRPALQYKTSAYGGYGYNFWGPNLELRPEFKTSYEFGTELGFFEDRLGIDVATYRAETTDQIVDNIRGSYGTGFVLYNLNGGTTRNRGLEVTVRGTPVLRDRFSWDFTVNFDRSRGEVVSLPAQVPEFYNSDTWLYGDVRGGTAPGMSTRSLTGRFYLRNKDGAILIDPTTGLPLRSTGFVDAGYDRQPDYTVGIQNNLKLGRATLSFLVDVRRGGDILNATEHFLTTRGLSMRTMDRDQPRVIPGVLRDGRENSSNPTQNTIVVVPAVNTGYYTNMSEELFIEEDVNWLRLRDVTLRFGLPRRFGSNTSVYVTGTDLYLLTNYSGLDPIVNGNTAAVGGAGGVGIDYGNFPMPRGINLGIRTSF